MWRYLQLFISGTIGFLIPLSIASKTLLVHELKQRGVQTHLLPWPLIKELADNTLKIAQLVSKHGGMTTRDSLVHGTQAVADRVAELLIGQPVSRWDGRMEQEQRAEIATTLAKYRISTRVDS